MPALDSIPDKPKADESIGREFEEGIKLIATDPEQAVQLLGKVLEARNRIHGDLADECAESYLWYARALLEQARASTDALTTTKTKASAALKKADPSAATPAESKSEAADAKPTPPDAQPATAPDTKPDEATPAPPAPAAEADAAAPAPDAAKSEPETGATETQPAGKDSEAKADATAAPADGAKDGEAQAEDGESSEGGSEEGSDDEGSEGEEGEGEGDGDDKGEGEGGSGDCEDLILSYEMLEYARVICSKSTNPKLAPVYASVHLSLGDVAAERDDFDSALSEYARCQALLEKADKKDLRALAGVHFSTMLALTMVDNLTDARTHCKEAITLLQQSRKEIIAEMDTPVEGEAEASVDAQLDRLEKELDEIEALLKELKERLEDIDLAIKQQAEFKGVLRDAMKTLAAATGAGPSDADAGPSGAGPSAPRAEPAAAPAPAPFPAPTSQSAASGAAPVVQNLGVAGRGVRRITLQPITQPNQPTPAAPVSGGGVTTVGSKRALEGATGALPGGESAAKKAAVEPTSVAPAPATEPAVENQPTATAS